jgi:hypothetical protein
MRHAIRGGPWRYRGDAFVVTKLEVGMEPAITNPVQYGTNLGPVP